MSEFHDPGTLIDNDLELVLTDKYSGDPAINHVPAYKFKMKIAGQRYGTWIGRIDLRIGNIDRVVMYSGHIGYGVNLEHRGHHYAARACRLLLPLARSHGLEAVWITCNPDNVTSRRTCELAGAELVEIVDFSDDSDMYREGERQKCRYRIDLQGENDTNHE